MKKNNNNTIILIVIIIIIIIFLIFYFLINSCKKGKTFFNISSFSCKECAICPRGEWAKPGSCGGLSNTKCIPWTYCKTSERLLENATSYRDFKCEELGPITCNTGQYTSGLVSLRDGSRKKPSCRACTECQEELEEEVIECRYNSFNYNYPVVLDGRTFKPLSCIGKYDRICEPIKAIRNKDMTLISFKFNDINNKQIINKYLCSSRQSDKKNYINNIESKYKINDKGTLLKPLSLVDYDENIKSSLEWYIEGINIQGNPSIDGKCTLRNKATVRIYQTDPNDPNYYNYLTTFKDSNNKYTSGYISSNINEITTIKSFGNYNTIFQIIDSTYEKTYILNEDTINHKIDIIDNEASEASNFIKLRLFDNDNESSEEQDDFQNYFYLGSKYNYSVFGDIPILDNGTQDNSKIQLTKI